jgi:hypothetical protein
MSSGKRSKCFNLPKELIEWLEEFSNQAKITVDDLVAHILYRFYEVWNLAKQYALEQQGKEQEEVFKPSSINLDSLAQEFIKRYRTSHNVGIVKHFLLWLKGRGLTIDMLGEDHVKEFLEEYTKIHNLSKYSLYNYKSILKKFINFVKESSKISQ